MSKKANNGKIIFFITKQENDMRRKGIIRTKTLKKYVAQGNVHSISAIETESGNYHLLVCDINGEESYLTTYRKLDYRAFATLDAFWKYCKSIGINHVGVFSSQFIKNLKEEKDV